MVPHIRILLVDTSCNHGNGLDIGQVCKIGGGPSARLGQGLRLGLV